MAAAAAAVTLALTGCAASTDDAAEGETITLKVAATTTPMTDVVQAAAEVIEAPYEIEMVEVADYVQPNSMLQHGELDANFVQHPPFMAEYNAANDATLVAVEPVYLTQVGMYSSKHGSFDDVPEDGQIVIPQDASNQARALLMVQAAGLITIDPAVEETVVTVDDVLENPKNLTFTEIDIMSLVSAYPEADAVFLHPTFARQLELTPEEDALALEQDEAFAVSLVTREEDADSEATSALVDAFHSEGVRAKLEELGVPAAF
ncbi:D-methionine-binding lipoprotein MetQ [Gulosibacter molinativorax]|uniref:D-methionine-binding lipoprotein MetQ n=2 Tax=Gulosibacter molinativorax TaxID=256821 RepID=A0ABT7CAN9_9MICO|nr:D-methionine-binding lipoprotein MetQ [Gulosibacter molinativorax]